METMKINRGARERSEDPQMMPGPVEGQRDLVTVDTTWGELQPMEVAPGVRTIGELASHRSSLPKASPWSTCASTTSRSRRCPALSICLTEPSSTTARSSMYTTA